MENEQRSDDYLQSIKEGFSGFKDRVGKMMDEWFAEDSGYVGELRVPVAVYETKEHFVIEVELPGARKSDVSMQIVDDELVVKGVKRRDLDVTIMETYREERRYGEFLRHFPLPDYIETENIKAKYEHGLLVVRFPKTDVDPEDSTEISID